MAALPSDIQSTALYQSGYLDVTAYSGVDPTGSSDSITGIRVALEDAFNNNRALYFPAGTYLISKPIHAMTYWVSGMKGKHRVLVGSTKGSSRPLIKITNNAPLFDSTSKKRAMISFRTFKNLGSNPLPTQAQLDNMGLEGVPPGWDNNSGNGYEQLLQGIDLDTNGHVGAVGVQFRQAQDSVLLDVKVTATGSYAGFYEYGRAGSGLCNVKVIGGQYGLYGKSNTYSSVVGATLTNQTNSAIHHVSQIPVSLVGFHITKNSGPAVKIVSGGSSVGSVSLIDGVIEMGDSSVAIDNPGGQNLTVNDVYITGTNKLIDSGAGRVTGSGAWKRIKKYSHITPDNPDSYSLIDGSTGTAREPSRAKSIVSNAGAPPSDLISNHIWTKLPNFNDGATGSSELGQFENIVDHGATPDNGSNDDGSAIEAAIAAAESAGHNRVLVPAGTFHLKSTVDMRKDTKLFGIGNAYSIVAGSASWNPTSATPMIRSANQVDAEAYLGLLQLEYPTDSSVSNDWFTPIHWRSGRKSFLVGNELEKGSNEGNKNAATNPRPLVRFSHNAGGRVYFLMSHARPYNIEHTGYRIILVEGTTQPLALYNINLEKAKGKYFMEIKNSSNVRIYTAIKIEGGGSTFSTVGINNSTNVAMYGLGKLKKPISSDRGYVEVTGGSDDVLAASLLIQKANSGGYTLVDKTDKTVGIDMGDSVSVYMKGDIDDSKMKMGGTLPQRTLTTSVSGSGYITLNPSGGTYDDGALVTVTAYPASGWQFDNWSGNLSGSTNPTILTLDSNKSVTADFSTIGVEVEHPIQSAVAGSVRSGYTVDRAYDSAGISTYFQSEKSNNWAEFDVGTPDKSITKVRVYHTFGADRPADLKVDGATEWSGTLVSNTWNEIVLSGVSGQKVRLEVTNNRGLRINDIEIWGN